MSVKKRPSRWPSKRYRLRLDWPSLCSVHDLVVNQRDHKEALCSLCVQTVLREWSRPERQWEGRLHKCRYALFIHRKKSVSRTQKNCNIFGSSALPLHQTRYRWGHSSVAVYENITEREWEEDTVVDNATYVCVVLDIKKTQAWKKQQHTVYFFFVEVVDRVAVKKILLKDPSWEDESKRRFVWRDSTKRPSSHTSVWLKPLPVCVSLSSLHSASILLKRFKRKPRSHSHKEKVVAMTFNTFQSNEWQILCSFLVIDCSSSRSVKNCKKNDWKHWKNNFLLFPPSLVSKPFISQTWPTRESLWKRVSSSVYPIGQSAGFQVTISEGESLSLSEIIFLSHMHSYFKRKKGIKIQEWVWRRRKSTRMACLFLRNM